MAAHDNLKAEIDDDSEFLDELPAGTELMHGQYKIIDFLNAGGFGITYLAKDSLSSAERVRAMYPEIDAWRAEVAKADPEGALATDLIKRLKLREAT